jgi:ATP-binding cassette subfamily F protein 3
MLHIKDLTYRIDGRLLLDGATGVIPKGKRYALFGRNGCGKSTLFALIQKFITPEGGSISVQPKAKMMAVAQEAPDGPQSILQTVLDSHLELKDLWEREKTAEDPMEIAEIHERFADLDAYSAHARAATLMSGLGFSTEEQNRPCNSFSGGWRMRVALACALFNQPDLLLLDEPTNYLDLEGVIWLENFLKSYPYTVFLISHDRDLLNNVVHGIFHLIDGKLTHYTGGYDQFEETRRLQFERVASMASKQEAARRHLQKFVDRFRAKANKAKQAQSRVKMLEKMKPIVSMTEEHTVPFTFPNPEPLSPPLISLDGTSVGYEKGKPILKDLNLYLDMDDRIALLGQNGNGKSTFAKLLSGRLKPMDGSFRKPRSLKIGYFAQHQLDELRPKESPLDHLRDLMPDTTEAKRRAQLGAFGFGVDKADRAVETLSGGEKARLLLALMSREKPHVMILDEPTNHLDVDSREALIHALNGYDGTLILITHDRHMLEACADRLMIVEDGTLSKFEGDLGDYKKHLLKARRVSNSDQRSIKKNTIDTTGMSKKEARKAKAEARERIAPLKKAVEQALKKVENLGKDIVAIDKALNDPELYGDDNPDGIDKSLRLQREKGHLEEKLENAEDAWMAAEETYLTAKAEQ